MTLLTAAEIAAELHVSKLPDMHTGVTNTAAPDAQDRTRRTRKALKSR